MKEVKTAKRTEMTNADKYGIARTVSGFTLVGVGGTALVVVLPHLIPTVLQWLRNYPTWLTFPVGLIVFGLGVFLAVTEHIKSAEKAHKTDNNNYPKRS